jgi:hypothetical protein
MQGVDPCRIESSDGTRMCVVHLVEHLCPRPLEVQRLPAPDLPLVACTDPDLLRTHLLELLASHPFLLVGPVAFGGRDVSAT